MSYQIKRTPMFARQSGRLERKYASWPDDLTALLTELTENPVSGVSLGRGCYKVRVAIASKNRGKSGGARVITLVQIVGKTVLLLGVYDKSDRENLAPGELEMLLAAAGVR